jgi:DNA-binding transcriptional LysR family regulator
LPSNEAVRAAAAAGAGVAALSRLVAEDALKAGTLVAVDIALPKRSFSARRLEERHETAAARAFLEHLRREARGAAG